MEGIRSGWWMNVTYVVRVNNNNEGEKKTRNTERTKIKIARSYGSSWQPEPNRDGKECVAELALCAVVHKYVARNAE